MTNHRRVVQFLFLAAFAAGSSFDAHAGAQLAEPIIGIVQVKSGGTDEWRLIKTVPADLAGGDTVRTGLRAQVTLVLDDGSKVELGSNASFTLEETSPSRSMFKLDFGRMRAWVQRLGARKFQVRTPTAVCSVRGTEFSVDVAPGGQTVVDLYKGLLAVEDQRGQQVLLRPNERIQVDSGGLGTPSALQSQTEVQQTQFHSVMRREMSLDMSKEEVQAAAAREIKLAEFQQGKALVDVFGERVRLEEYIIRPTANQFKLVVLNERANRFDYFYYLGTFNTTLPSDLSVALRQLGGSLDNAPTFWLTGFETGRSNTKDSAVELANGGHPVDVNNNASLTDDITQFYNPSTDRFEDVTGRSVYQTLFDNYGFYLNGGLKYGWTGSNIDSYSQITNASTNDPITGALLAQALPARSVSVTFPEANNVHQVIYESYSDGTFTKWDNYIINDEGRVAQISDFQGITSGTQYKQRLLNFNYEQVITATEFQGRKIDLVVEPKILIQSGLIQ